MEDSFVINNLAPIATEEEDVFIQQEWEFEKERKIVVFDSKLSEKVERHLDEVIRKPVLERSAFSLGDLNESPSYRHVIRTLPHAPIFIPKYRESLHVQKLIADEVKIMLQHNIIRISKSPYSFGVRMIIRLNKTRFCVNFIPLNKVTIPQQWPIPRPQDIFDRCAGSIYFTTLDLISGYWQIRFDKNSIEMAAFSTADGHYEFLRMSF